MEELLSKIDSKQIEEEFQIIKNDIIYNINIKLMKNNISQNIKISKLKFLINLIN